MPKQISDEEYSYLQNRRITADFVESIYNDPALNKEAKQLIKKKYPSLAIPDFDMEQKIDNRFAQRDAQIKARSDKRQQDAWKEKRSATQKQYGFTDEAMKDLEKFMVEKNIGDYDVAAHYKAAKDPKPVEAQFSDQHWNHHKKEGWEEIAKDPEGWGRNQILGAIHRDMAKAKGQT